MASDSSNIYGSITSEAKKIIVHARPSALLVGDTVLCAGGEAVLSINLTGASPWNLQLSDSSTYNNIDEGSYSLSVGPTTSEVYTILSLVDGNGCSAREEDLSGSASVSLREIPALNVYKGTENFTDSITVTEGEEVTIRVTGADSYNWSNGSTPIVSHSYL